MNALILETSSEKGCLVLAREGTVVAARTLTGGPELSKRLAEEADTLLKSCVFVPDWIAAGTGPGSYTGIRVGAALAKGLSYGWKIPLIGFCSLKAFVPPEEGPFVVLADAKRGGLYALFGEKKGEDAAFQEPVLLSASDPVLQNLSCVASPDVEAVRKRGVSSAIWRETGPDPAWLARLTRRQFLAEGTVPLQFSYLSSP